MSHRHVSARSYVFFGTETAPDAFEPGAGTKRVFAFDHDLDWPTRKLLPLNVHITTVP